MLDINLHQQRAIPSCLKRARFFLHVSIVQYLRSKRTASLFCWHFHSVSPVLLSLILPSLSAARQASVELHSSSDGVRQVPVGSGSRGGGELVPSVPLIDGGAGCGEGFCGSGAGLSLFRTCLVVGVTNVEDVSLGLLCSYNCTGFFLLGFLLGGGLVDAPRSNAPRESIAIGSR